MMLLKLVNIEQPELGYSIMENYIIWLMAMVIEESKMDIFVDVNIRTKTRKKLYYNYTNENNIKSLDGWTSSVPGCISGGTSHIRYTKVYNGPAKTSGEFTPMKI